jgi:hypothetical protein
MTDKPKPHANQGHADPDKTGRDQYKRHIDGDITIRGQIETHVPPSAEQQRNTERAEDKRREKKKFIVELLTLAAVVIYAGIAGWQGCISRDLLTTTVKQFQADQRPYVVEDGMTMLTFSTKQKGPPIVGQPIEVSVQFKNAGKTPALDVIVHRHLFFGEDNVEIFRPEPPDTKVTGDVVHPAKLDTRGRV